MHEEDITLSTLASFVIDSRYQLTALEGTCTILDEKISALENENKKLLQQNQELLSTNQKLRDEYEELRADHNQQVDDLTAWAERNLPP